MLQRNDSTMTLEARATLPAMQLVQSSKTNLRVAIALGVFFVSMPVLLMFVPWMQTVKGIGQVVAYSPIERRQDLNAPLDGFVVDYYGHRENALVRKGEPVFRMTAVDPNLAGRVKQQQDALRSKIQFAQSKVEAYADQVSLFEFARNMTVQAAQFGIEMTKNKIAGAEQNLRAAEADYTTQKGIHDRVEKLYKDPLHLASKQDWEVAEFKMKEASAKLEKARADLQAAQNELKSKEAELQQKQGEADAKVREASAKRDDANSELATALKDLQDVESKLAELERFVVNAPMDGRILRIHRAVETDFVKKGDAVVTLVPNTDDPAVELWLQGNDAPLVSGSKEIREANSENVKVRLVFEGWPAIQFAGWPSVAVGTFGGIVQLIDATDDGTGKFRILVVPDPEATPPWPDRKYLRQGVKANGWVLLNQVPLGWEIWRQLNGFPPVVAEQSIKKSDPEIYKRKFK